MGSARGIALTLFLSTCSLVYSQSCLTALLASTDVLETVQIYSNEYALDDDHISYEIASSTPSNSFDQVSDSIRILVNQSACPVGCTVTLNRYTDTFQGAASTVLFFDTDHSFYLPSHYVKDNKTTFVCVSNNGSCGATVPIYRYYKITNGGVFHAYSFDQDVMYDGYNQEFLPICYAWSIPTATVASRPSCGTLNFNIPPETLSDLNIYDNHMDGIERDHYYTTLRSTDISIAGYNQTGVLGKVLTSSKSTACSCLVKLQQQFDNQTGYFHRLDHKLIITGQEPNRPYEEYVETGETIYCAKRLGDCGATLPLWKHFQFYDVDTIYTTDSSPLPMSYLYPQTPLCYIWPANYSPNASSIVTGTVASAPPTPSTTQLPGASGASSTQIPTTGTTGTGSTKLLDSAGATNLSTSLGTASPTIPSTTSTISIPTNPGTVPISSSGTTVSSPADTPSTSSVWGTPSSTVSGGTLITSSGTIGTPSSSNVTLSGTSFTSSGTPASPTGLTVTSSGIAGTSSGTAGTPSGTTGTSSGTTNTPSGTAGTSSGTPATLTGSTVTSSGIAGTPSGTAGTPSGTTGTSSGTAGTPSGTAGTPSGLTGTSSGTAGTPSGTSHTPSGTNVTLSGTAFTSSGTPATPSGTPATTNTPSATAGTSSGTTGSIGVATSTAQTSPVTGGTPTTSIHLSDPSGGNPGPIIPVNFTIPTTPEYPVTLGEDVTEVYLETDTPLEEPFSPPTPETFTLSNFWYISTPITATAGSIQITSISAMTQSTVTTMPSASIGMTSVPTSPSTTPTSPTVGATSFISARTEPGTNPPGTLPSIGFSSIGTTPSTSRTEGSTATTAPPPVMVTGPLIFLIPTVGPQVTLPSSSAASTNMVFSSTPTSMTTGSTISINSPPATPTPQHVAQSAPTYSIVGGALDSFTNPPIIAALISSSVASTSSAPTLSQPTQTALNNIPPAATMVTTTEEPGIIWKAGDWISSTWHSVFGGNDKSNVTASTNQSLGIMTTTPRPMGGLVGSLINSTGNFFNDTKTFIGNTASGMTDTNFTSPVNSFLNTTGNFIDQHLNTNSSQAFVNNTVNWIDDKLGSTGEFLSNAWNSLGSNNSTTGNIVNNTQTWIGGAVNSTGGFLSNAWNSLQSNNSGTGTFVNKTETWIGGALNSTGGFLTNAWNSLGNNTTGDIVNNTKTWVGGAVDSTGQLLSNAWNSLGSSNSSGSAIDNTKTWVGGAVNSTGQFFSNAWNQTKDHFGNLSNPSQTTIDGHLNETSVGGAPTTETKNTESNVTAHVSAPHSNPVGSIASVILPIVNSSTTAQPNGEVAWNGGLVSGPITG